MSVIKAYDVAHVRFAAPDLGLMRTFLNDFGMTEIALGDDRLCMRGYSSSPFSHITERGESRFLGFGIRAKSLADLQLIASHDRVPVEPLDAPGGGKVARLYDPDGHTVEVVADQQPSDDAIMPRSVPWNHGGDYPRQGEFRRVERRPSRVKRLGHVVLAVSDYRRSLAWYTERFGFIISDEVQPEPGHGIGAFLRCDRGLESSDHHTLFIVERPGSPGFMHAAYEVQDLDDLMAGSEHLRNAGYEHFWGVGRHFLGSQVFDYWLDPFGNELEHWTDGDQLRAQDGGGVATMDQLLGVQWGMKMPPLPDFPRVL